MFERANENVSDSERETERKGERICSNVRIILKSLCVCMYVFRCLRISLFIHGQVSRLALSVVCHNSNYCHCFCC